MVDAQEQAARNRRLMIIVAVAVLVLATGALVKVVGDRQVEAAADELMQRLGRDLNALDLEALRAEAGQRSLGRPGSDPRAWFPGAGREQTSWVLADDGGSFWFEVGRLLSTRCVEVTVSPSDRTIRSFVPTGERPCAPPSR